MNKIAIALLFALFLPLPSVEARTQEAAQSSGAPVESGPIGRDAAAKLMPPTVFFAGKTAPVQGRNTAGARLPHGLLLAGLVDTAGYSSGVHERYQAYLLLDTPVSFEGKTLRPGAYGCGVVGSEFVVLDLGADELFRVPAQRDAVLAHPTPLQVVSGGGSYKLYFGRNAVSFAPAAP